VGAWVRTVVEFSLHVVKVGQAVERLVEGADAVERVADTLLDLLHAAHLRLDLGPAAQHRTATGRTTTSDEHTH
jgi:hypothetical protein